MAASDQKILLRANLLLARAKRVRLVLLVAAVAFAGLWLTGALGLTAALSCFAVIAAAALGSRRR